MSDSMSETRRRDMENVGLLECFHGPKEIDKGVFHLLHDGEEALTADDRDAVADPPDGGVPDSDTTRPCLSADPGCAVREEIFTNICLV